jgi:hypothetical protein
MAPFPDPPPASKGRRCIGPPESCRRGTTQDACVGVELYILKFPNGIHADEARMLMAAASSM